MIAFPQAKINLGLSILFKRTDGYHEIETVFYPVPVLDLLEIVPASQTSLIITGLKLEGRPEDNLVMRAYEMLRKDFSQILPLEIHLHKSIPSGAGLGGGSSDAAVLLNLLDKYFNLNIHPGQLAQYALRLGSDCSFFLHPVPSLAGGRGELLEPVSLDLSAYSILLVHPGIHIPSSWAFSQIKPGTPDFSVSAVIAETPVHWRSRLKNDFELPVFREYPQLQQIKEQLYAAGAIYASLTGSGSSLYGIFEKGGIPAGGIGTAVKQSFIP